MAPECHSLSNTCFARSSLLKTRGQELGVAGVMVHTHELSAENLEWEGVGEILALIILAGFILKNRTLHRHKK